MNQELKLQHSRSPVHQLTSFRNFIFSSRSSRHFLEIALPACSLQFAIFKMLYPFPDFISDSNSYIGTNLYHMNVNLWPIGYSRFIALIHAISHSDTLLVGIQYFALQAALMYLFYSILYIYRPNKSSTLCLFIFFFFNPIFLYLSNCVLSDAIFTALTIVFLGQFLWMLQKPKIHQILLQAIIIGLAFTIRYTAIYYPIISIVGLLLSRNT